tara:strand:- start:36 stop:461 length:426 start_codon:yes stop_codon:yes gene_type:complete
MQEKIVTLETAKLAKEKGFSMIKTTYSYDDSGAATHRDYVPHDFNIRGLLSAPTQSLLQKWLREEHNSIIEITMHCTQENYEDDVDFRKKEDFNFEVEVNYYGENFQVPLTEVSDFYNFGYGSYEEALEAGLQEALELIKK